MRTAVSLSAIALTCRRAHAPRDRVGRHTDPVTGSDDRRPPSTDLDGLVRFSRRRPSPYGTHAPPADGRLVDPRRAEAPGRLHHPRRLVVQRRQEADDRDHAELRRPAATRSSTSTTGSPPTRPGPRSAPTRWTPSPRRSRHARPLGVRPEQLRGGRLLRGRPHRRRRGHLRQRHAGAQGRRGHVADHLAAAAYTDGADRRRPLHSSKLRKAAIKLAGGCAPKGKCSRIWASMEVRLARQPQATRRC